MPYFLDFNVDEFMHSMNSKQTEFRQQLVQASLLLMVFEEFKKYLIQHVESFFLMDFTSTKAQLDIKEVENL